MKRSIISSLLALSLLAASTPLYAHPAPAEIRQLTTGPNYLTYAETGPRVGQTIARWEFLSALIRESGLNLDNIYFFKALDVRDVATDVSHGAPYANDIIIAGHYGILESGKAFRPGDPVTREEAALMAVKALNAKVGDLPLTLQLILFEDADSIGSQYSDAIQSTCKLGLFGIEKRFRPADPLTRSEYSAFLQAFQKVLKNGGKENSDPTRIVFNIGRNIYIKGGITIKMDAPPFLKNGRAFVPVRFLALALGIPEDSITWSPSSQTVTISKEGSTVVMAPGGNIMYVNSQARTMDVEPVLVNGRVYLPSRYVAEALGWKVDWDGAEESVLITESR